MRDIHKVVNDMKLYIDDEDTVREFNKILGDVTYTAPEEMYIRWNLIHEVMMDYLPEDVTTWNEDQCRLVSTFTGMPLEDLQASIRS